MYCVGRCEIILGEWKCAGTGWPCKSISYVSARLHINLVAQDWGSTCCRLCPVYWDRWWTLRVNSRLVWGRGKSCSHNPCSSWRNRTADNIVCNDSNVVEYATSETRDRVAGLWGISSLILVCVVTSILLFPLEDIVSHSWSTIIKRSLPCHFDLSGARLC